MTNDSRDRDRQLPLFTHGAEYTTPDLPTVNAFRQTGAHRVSNSGHAPTVIVPRRRAPWIVRMIGRTVAVAAIGCLVIAGLLVWGAISLLAPGGVSVPSFPPTVTSTNDVPTPGGSDVRTPDGNAPVIPGPVDVTHKPTTDERSPSAATGAVPIPPIVPAEPLSPISPAEPLSSISPVESLASTTAEVPHGSTAVSVTE